jgi:hypothetical protein
MFRQECLKQDVEFQLKNRHGKNMPLLILQVKMLQHAKMSDWKNVSFTDW